MDQSDLDSRFSRSRFLPPHRISTTLLRSGTGGDNYRGPREKSSRPSGKRRNEWNPGRFVVDNP